MHRIQRRLARLYHGTASGRELVAQTIAFPVVDLEVLTQGRPLLVLAPHADDESLGCGGLIAEACDRGHVVHVIVLSDGAASHPGSTMYPAPVLAALRIQETLDAVRCLGLAAGHVTFLNLPDGRLPHSLRGARAVAGQVAAIGHSIGAASIFATWQFDMHADHVAAYSYGQLAARALGAALYAYPVWGLIPTDQARLPAVQLRGVSLDIDKHIGAKRKAVLAHRSQTSDLIADSRHSYCLTSQELDVLITDRERFIVVCTRR